ncbi:GNAT family N-acetyltransferase [Pelagibius litoralis]|uniref:GNAT family N-acetyltransferase n=1 Tax=Pelagibius litoralis TaxID=374515 RepID=A0A967F3A4_9PROT|nr:GNAT family protein [Pelagibius litoralis]NIA72212.1 GNAT family N-acetyltransferase [Pelagibius litoralis]
MLFTVFRGDGPLSVRLEGPRVYLCPPRMADWKAWAELREESREFLVPWEPTWPHDALARAAFRRRLKAYNHEWRRGTGFSFLVYRLNDRALMGGVTLSNLRRGVAQAASMGYWIGARFARQGYMTEAVASVVEFAFEELGLHRIEAACLPNNDASQALLLKAGFRQEGYARQYLRINGKWQDHLLFEMLRDDARL